MKIAQLAPLWETVPPKAYGGTELVVYNLCEEFTQRGHDVTLFAAGDSKTSAKLHPLIEKAMRESGLTMQESGVRNAIFHELKAISKVIEVSDEFDIIHNHMGYQFLPFINLIKKPVVTTLHGAFVSNAEMEFCRHYKKHPFISISNSQRANAQELNYIATVYNGIQIERFPFQAEPDLKNPYITFLGRISEEKGAHLAIKLAKETGHKLIMAGKVDKHDLEYYESIVKPLIDNKQIIYIGELGHEAKCLLLKNALATIHPVTWPEPFGLVMAESMLCGTPVLALNQGSIPEVIKDKETGFIEDNIDNLIKRVNDIDQIDRIACRKHVENNFSAQKMADGYLSAYEKLINQKFSVIDTEIPVTRSFNGT